MAATRGGLGDASRSGVPFDRPIDEAWIWVCEFLECTPQDLAVGVAKAFRLNVADLGDVDLAAIALVPQKLARSLNVLPLHATDRDITVATSEPIDYDAERQLGFMTSRRTVFQVAEPAALSAAIEAAYASKPARAPIGGPDLEAAFNKVQPDEAAIALAPAHTSTPATMKVCRLILYEALQAGASEVHLSMGASTGRVQFKVAGALTTFIRVPPDTLVAASQRFRGMAGIDDTDNRVIETVGFRIERKPYDVKIQTIPGYPDNLVLGFVGAVAAASAPEAASVLEPASVPEPASAPRARAVPAPDAAADAEAQREEAHVAAWRRRDDEDEGHILVVDDDEGGRLLMRTILERNGFRVSEADDGSTALPFLEHTEDVDGILLDLMMKNVDGMEVLKKVRKSRKLAALPIVILTASEDPEDEKRLLKAGADDYLKKPIDHHQLIQRIQAVMRRARSS